MGLTVEQVNHILEDLNTYNLKQKFKLVAEEENDWEMSNLDQGDEGTKTSIFKLGIEDLHLKVVKVTDSYGDYKGVSSLKIVRPVTKQVTNFE